MPFHPRSLLLAIVEGERAGLRREKSLLKSVAYESPLLQRLDPLWNPQFVSSETFVAFFNAVFPPGKMA